MVVSQTTEYALRAVVCLAQHTGQALTTQQLSDTTGVSFSYLPKVLQPLIRCGIISAQRGLHGGYTLQRDPNQLSVLDVIQCVDPGAGTTHHESEQMQAESFTCLRQLLEQVNTDTEQHFANTSISQLMDPQGSALPADANGNAS